MGQVADYNNKCLMILLLLKLPSVKKFLCCTYSGGKIIIQESRQITTQYKRVIYLPTVYQCEPQLTIK